jgi:hypothetical protein
MFGTARLYDLVILWRSGRAAFAGKRDMLLLALGAPLAMLLAIRGMNHAAAAMAALPLAASLLFPAAAGIVVQTGVARRLRHLREESVVARHALRRGPAQCHGIFWNLAPLGLAVALALLSAPGDLRRAALFGLAYLLGMVVAHAQVLVSMRFRQWLDGRDRNRSEGSAELSGATKGESGWRNCSRHGPGSWACRCAETCCSRRCWASASAPPIAG